MTDRHLVVVDIETTGLDPQNHVPIEVVAINVDTLETLHFVPFVDSMQLACASFDALRINRYYERGVYRDMLSHDQTQEKYHQLWDMLRGNTFAGSNPRFDAQMLEVATGWAPSWHHRLADVSSYVAGALHMYPAELKGLEDCCKSLSVVNTEPHSALGDAQATAECFRKAQYR
jgi:DNA polymerase-3 subunit epsilon